MTLENPIFHLSLIQSVLLESGGPPVLRKEERLVRNLIVLNTIATNDEGSMFLKYLTVNSEVTSMLFI